MLKYWCDVICLPDAQNKLIRSVPDHGMDCEWGKMFEDPIVILFENIHIHLIMWVKSKCTSNAIAIANAIIRHSIHPSNSIQMFVNRNEGFLLPRPKWNVCVWINLPPPFANIDGIGGKTVPVGCIKLVGGIVEIVAPASCAAECGQTVSTQFGICHWLLALGPTPPMPPTPPPPLPQYESVAKLSWLPEHCRRWGRGGDDCLE